MKSGWKKPSTYSKARWHGIRTGRANPGLVDSLRVEVYGAPVILKSVAQVGAPEPTQIVIRPFDPGTIKDIEKAIRASDLGFNPSNDGRVIRIAVPPLSTDVRRKLVGRIKEMAEDARVSIRNVRRDGNKAADDGREGQIADRGRLQAGEGTNPRVDQAV